MAKRGGRIAKNTRDNLEKELVQEKKMEKDIL